MATTLRTYAASNGNHVFGNSLGIYFTVASGYTLTVSDMGCFLPGGGPPIGPGVTINVKLANRSAPTTILASATLDEGNPGSSISGTRLTTVSITPVVLPAGDYCVWAYGFGATFMAYNSSQPTPGTAPVTDTYGGAITLGNDYYSISTTMPTTDGTTTKFGGPTFIATAASTGNMDDETMTVNSQIEFNALTTAWTAATGTAAADVVRLTQSGEGEIYYSVAGSTPAATVVGTRVTPYGKMLTIGTAKNLYIRNNGAGSVSIDIGTA